MTSPRVGFLIGGVQKAGTTALAHYLGAHPMVRLPAGKEAHVFDSADFDEGATPEAVDARYEPAFGDWTDALHGDATPIYLLHPRFIGRVARYNPAMRWILVLRDPAERALSQYHMERARGDETWPLWAAMLLERWRLRGHHDDFSAASPLRHHGYRLRGDYARQLDALHAHFPQDQVLLLRSADLRADPDQALRSVCGFLGLAPMARPLQPARVFVGSYRELPRNALRMRLLRWLMRSERRAMRQSYGISFDP
jgi:hypothetical protein